MIYFISDLHLGHKSIVTHRTGFSSIEEHDQLFFDQFAKLNKRDIVFILGDFIFDSDKYQYYIDVFNKFSCRIKLLMGNHDSLRLYKETRFEMQLPLFSYKNIWLSHAPIHSSELRNRLGNIHGHTHYHCVDDSRYMNVCPENTRNKLVDFESIFFLS